MFALRTIMNARSKLCVFTTEYVNTYCILPLNRIYCAFYSSNNHIMATYCPPLM